MENKTAVKWLYDRLIDLKFIEFPNSNLLEKLLFDAKELEKEQIIDALFFGIHLEYNNIDSPLERAEQYYNETFSNTGD